MAEKLLGFETASYHIPHINCTSDTEEDEDGNLFSIQSNWRHQKYSLFLHILDTNTINSVMELKGKNSANRDKYSSQKNIEKELEKLKSSKGKGRQTQVPEGEPPSVVNTELDLQNYLPVGDLEEMNIETFIIEAMYKNSQDVVENNNNEAPTASISQAPHAINSAEENPPLPQQDGKDQMVIHPAFSGPTATDPNPGCNNP
ncbi:hypothetical protein PPACK8108_LOCUS25544 [Phakopsora pachyrhizi]|uniref:Uncharacterized protein n=1 Tax=Phakopsora pachyrhizi TaxID=170000 RepID=A0AAV0BS69_PHAPC|nr:hypothetical protein PPACK8108_LOCUS25544 [Phakopsora pachyrhizi]